MIRWSPAPVISGDKRLGVPRIAITFKKVDRLGYPSANFPQPVEQKKIDMKKAFKKLKPATKKWVRQVENTWTLDPHHQRLLVLAGQAWDRAQEAKDQVDSDGSIIKDRFDQLKQHIGCELERQSMLTFCRLLREIGLDIQEPEDNRPLMRPGGY